MDIKGKIEEFINSLKDKLPSKKSSDDLEGDDFPAEDDSESPTKQDHGPPPEDSEEGLGDEEEGPSSDKKKLIIQIVLGVAILYLVYDQFLAPPANNPAPVTPEANQKIQETAKAPPPPTKKTPPPQKPPPTNKGYVIEGENEQATPETKKDDGVVLLDEKPVPESQKDDGVVLLDEKPAPEAKKDDGVVLLDEKPAPEAKKDDGVVLLDENTAKTQESTEVNESTTDDVPPPNDPPPTGQAIYNTNDDGEIISETGKANNDSDSAAPPSVNGQASSETTPSSVESGEDSLAPKKIRQNLKYTSPPDYTQSGRGLVYNCKGQHWACVDKSSYFACRENYFWFMQENKPPECAIKNVYANDHDCHIVHTHYLNNQEPTDFCQVSDNSTP